MGGTDHESTWVTSEAGGHRLRVCSPSELNARESALLELAEALEQMDVPYFLADGALLGAARNGDFIPWDNDVGIWMMAEVFSSNKEDIIRNLRSRNFSVCNVNGRNPKLNIFKNSEKFEIESWKLLGKSRARGGYRIPMHLLENPSEIELRGRLYPCPSPIEEFLSHRFGNDWKTPRVLWESHFSSMTPWALAKIKLRRLSPEWLIHILGRT